MSSSNSKNVKSLSKQLAGVAKQAKSLGINTSKADAMVKQTNREGGKSFSGSKEEKAYTAAIPMTALLPTDVADTADYTKQADYSGLMSSIATPGYIKDANGQMVVDPNLGANGKLQAESTKTGFESLMGMLNNAPVAESSADRYENVYGITAKQAQRDFADARAQKDQYTSQLNNIIAKQQQDLLQVRQTGSENGVTEAVYGGQQLTINREAAIRALPVQAALATAQANYDDAKTHLDNYFKVLSDDADKKFTRLSNAYNAVVTFATQAQENQLNAAFADRKEKLGLEAENRANLQNLAMQAVEYGQSGLLQSITSIKADDPNFETKYNSMLGRLSKPVVATKRDTAFNSAGDLVDMQTGEIITKATGGATTEKQEQLNNALSIAKELRLDTAVGKSGAVGFALQKFVPFGQSVGLQPNRAAYEARVDTLKANLTLDNLKLLKGAMSDKDLAFLQAVGSSLNTNMSETEFNKELDKVITKLESAGGVTTSSTGYALTKKGVSFDVNKAKQAGYTDAEIQAYLATN